MELHRVAVGELYNPRRTSWPETPYLSLGAHGAELVLFYARPTPEEIAAARTGAASFAWLDGGDSLGGMLAYVVEPGLPWSLAPYHAAREQPGRDGDVGPDGKGMQLQLVLVCAATGVTKAIRVMPVPAAAADQIRATVRAQQAADFDAAAHDAWVQRLYAAAPGPSGARRLARERAICRWSVPERAAGDGDAAPDVSSGKAEQLLARLYEGLYVPGRTADGYPGRRLHDSLQPWYIYLGDGGHSVAVAVTSLYQPGADPETYIAALPVKTVQRHGWNLRSITGIQQPVPFVNLGYDPQTGPRFPASDEEL